MKNMAEDKRYNGWTNYETWLVKLWMDNDQGSDEYWRERAQEAWNDATPGSYEWQTREEEAVSALADEIKEQHEESVESCGVTGVLSDLLNAALSEVNWREIARAYLDEVDKAADDADEDDDEDNSEEE
jgi:hypothetical protein